MVTMNRRDWTMLILLGTLWGSSFLFVNIAVRELPPLGVAWGRVVVAAATLTVVVALAGRAPPLTRRMLGVILVMGVLNNAIPFTMMAFGQARIAAGVASIINASMPLLTALIAHVALRDEKLTAMKLGGVLIGLFGVMSMVGASALQGLGAQVTGQLAVLGASLFYAIATVYGRRLSRLGLTANEIAWGQSVAAAAVLAPVALIAAPPTTWAGMAPAGWWSVIALGAVCTGGGYLLYFRLLANAGAVNVSLAIFLVPVSGVLLGALFLGETLAPRHLAGMAAILFGLSLIDGRLYRRGGRK